MQALCGGTVDACSLPYVMKYGHSDLLVGWINKEILSINLVDQKEKSVLHYAAEYGFDAVIEKLLAGGVNVNCCDVKNKTPLHYAAKNVKGAAVMMLLSCHNADVYAVDKKGHTPFHYTSRRKRIECDDADREKAIKSIRALLKSYYEKY